MAKAKKKSSKKIISVHKTVHPVRRIIHKSEHKPIHHLTRHVVRNADDDATTQALVSNFVALQKVMTNLSLKLDDVANKMSKLLDLFEISAKSLAEKDFEIMGNKNLDKKIDNLLEQNKILARGITLMHDRLPSESPKKIEMPSAKPVQLMQTASQQMMPPAPIMQRQMTTPFEQAPPAQRGIPGYQKSLTPQAEEENVSENAIER